jgi:hypothetical protein
LRLRAKQLKTRSRAVYYLLKWALLGGLFYLVFVYLPRRGVGRAVRRIAAGGRLDRGRPTDSGHTA